jgi:hypothetical protein
MTSPMKRGWMVSGVLVLIALAGGWNSQRAQRQIDSAAQLARQPEVVLFDLSVPAEFISSLRYEDSTRKFIALEASANKDQIKHAVAKDAARFVVVFDALPSNVASDAKLSLPATLSSDPQFKLLGTYPVISGSVFLYRIRDNVATSRLVPVRMFAVNSPRPELAAVSAIPAIK